MPDPAPDSAPDPDATGAYTPETPPAPGERFPPGTLLAGRYRVVAALGKGGMGEVYRADDLTLGQPVALKFLPTHLAADPDRLARFRKEVAVARRVSHPNVCRVYDIAEHGGQPFLTMEFVDGEDLASLIRRVGRVAEEKGVEVARQLCAALVAVHDQGLLHRDLKPANVMLDGRGQVRLTDFGLAAAAGDLSASEVRSGTPLYQAPEQITGRDVTVRSDIYALGLVLYELFTGRRAFANAGRDSAPSKPSSHVSNLSPLVEQVILKCLEADPANRPRSAVEVMSRLPGGDPLAAAVAAGETPSPKMVADAPVEGTLRPAVAIGLFAVVFVGLVVTAALNDHFKAYRAMPLPPPAEMEFKAKAMLRELGYTDPPRHSASGYTDSEVLGALRSGRFADLPAGERPHLASARPALAVFFYRESPRFLGAVRQEGVNPVGTRDVVSANNPPHDEPGMAGVVLDTHGRLVKLTAVPNPNAPPPAKPVEWGALLKAAGLDAPGVLKEVPNPSPPVAPPVFADRTAVWEGTYPERPEMRVRVEAGSYRGRPVYFRISHPELPSPSRPPGVDRPENPYLDAFFALVVLGLLTALGVFAVRNYRRADVRGALLLGGVLFVAMMLEWAFGGRHLFSVGAGVIRFTQAFATTLYYVVIAVGCYLTLEPVVRRRCPHVLTSWTRLFAGRWHDPLVGRDILIGAAVVLVVFDAPVTALLISPGEPAVIEKRTFASPGEHLFFAAGTAVGVSWFYSSFFAVWLAVVRRQWVAFGLLYGLLLVIFLSDTGGEPVPVVREALRALAAVVLLARVGMLALVSYLFLLILVLHSPLTLDPSAWYFGASMTYMLAITALAGYGAWTSLGGRPLFGKGFFGDE
jgi:hypothetical protein